MSRKRAACIVPGFIFVLVVATGGTPPLSATEASAAPGSLVASVSAAPAAVVEAEHVAGTQDGFWDTLCRMLRVCR